MVYAVIEDNCVLRIRKDKKELEDYLKEFLLEERRKMYIVALGEKEQLGIKEEEKKNV
jgi:hypothetical protein